MYGKFHKLKIFRNFWLIACECYYSLYHFCKNINMLNEEKVWMVSIVEIKVNNFEKKYLGFPLIS